MTQINTEARNLLGMDAVELNERFRIGDASRFRPLPVESPLERVRRRERESQQGPGFFGVIGSAIGSEQILPELVRKWGRSQAANVDPDFQGVFLLPEEQKNRLLEGIPPAFYSGFNDAVSLEHAETIAEQLREVAKNERILQQAGFGGGVARVGAAILDPALLPAALIPGGAIGGASTKVGRLGAIARSGFVAGGIEAGIEGFVGGTDPTRGTNDVIFAGMAGFALGGAAGAISRAARLRELEAATRIRKRIEFSEALDNGLDISTPQGRTYFQQQLNPDEQRAFLRQLIEDQGFEGEDFNEAMQLIESGDIDGVIERMNRAPEQLREQQQLLFEHPVAEFAEEPEVVGRTAARETGEEVAEEGGEEVAEDVAPEIPKQRGDLRLLGRLTDAMSRFGPVRWSMAGLLGRNPVPDVRKATNAMMQDALPKVGDVPQPEAASEWVTKETSRRMGLYWRTSLRHAQEWARKNNRPRYASLRNQDEFFEEVGRAIRRPKGAYTNDPNINAVADLQRAHYRDLALVAKRHRVSGFERVTPNDTYVPRLWAPARMSNLIDEFGEDQIRTVLEQAIFKGQDIDGELAERVSRTMLRTIMNGEEFTDLDRSLILSSQGDTRFLERVLREEGLSDAQINTVLDAVRPRRSGRTITSRAKRRVELDETVRLNLEDKNGNMRSVGIEDMVENNAAELMELYTRQIIGASAASEVYRALGADMGVEISNFADLRRQLERRMRDAGMDARDITRDLDKLETADKVIRGARIGSNSRAAAFLRSMRLWNFLRISGTFGVAQMPEFGIIVGETGFRALFQQLPALRRIWSRTKTGEMSDQLLEEIQVLTGNGFSRLNNQILSRVDREGQLTEWGGGNLERRLRQGSRIANDVSFMAPIHIAQQNMFMMLAAQKLTNIAASGRPMSKRRLSALGLTPEQGDAIFRQIKKHATTEEGALGRRLKQINIDAWDDVEAASNLVSALRRWSSSAVQENDIGNLAQWMTKDVGRVILQFRSFAAVAWEKQLLRRLSMRDWQTVVELGLTTAVAGLAYMAQQHLRTIGDPNREELLEERLSLPNLARSAFQRAGYSSFLPDIGDAVSVLSGHGQVFNARNSGLSTFGSFDLLGMASNPTTSMGDDLLNTVASSTRSFLSEDEAFTQRDAENAATLLPFSRTLGARLLINAMMRPLPEDEN